MKYFCIIYLLSLLVQNTHGFVLLSPNPPRFPSGTIKIKVNQDNCENLSDTYTDIEALLKEVKSSLLKNEHIDGVKLYLEVESNNNYLTK